jgi:hypothetical protein
MEEPRVVVTHREHLWWLLAEAAQLEHMVMCQYLYAELSLKSGTSEGLTVEQAEAVERWRAVLRSIATEEMLHLALVANLMSAIGAAPTFTRPNFPQGAHFFPGGIRMALLPFGEPALQHFLFLERPEGITRADADGFGPAEPARPPVTQDEIGPRGQEFATVGHLYRGVEDGLRALVAGQGEAALFVGRAEAQATPGLFRWPQLIAVTNLATALAAIEEIIEQGEGARGDWRNAHYGRFLGVMEELRSMRERDPDFQPARPVTPGFTRQPFDLTEPQPVIAEAGTHLLAELAGLSYELVLQILVRFFTQTDETDEQRRVLIRAAIAMMTGVLRPLASALTTRRHGRTAPGSTTGFAFEMYYTMGNFVPDRKAAWSLLHERLSLLVDRCAAAAQLNDPDGELTAAHACAVTIASTLVVHLPRTPQ